MNKVRKNKKEFIETIITDDEYIIHNFQH
jgi:hypothetical protein